MRRLIATVVLLFSLFGVVGQGQGGRNMWKNTYRDYKSSIHFDAFYASFAVSPSGEIWLSNNYSLWHTHGMSSVWKKVPHPYSIAVDFSYVVCPDTNTVLVFGRMFDPSDSTSRYNKYMRSTDGGKNWDFLSMPRKMERDKIWVESRAGGKVWLRLDSILYYSIDKGLNFRELAAIPYVSSLKFDMENNGLCGVGKRDMRDSSGKTRDEILITKDNWKHYEVVPTPCEQHPEIKQRSYFFEFAICRSILVVEQSDKYFWTSIDTICWREIPLDIRDFIVDRESNEWVIVTRGNSLLRSSDMLTFDTVNTGGPCYFAKIKYADRQSVYGMSYNAHKMRFLRSIIDTLYRFSTDGLNSCGLYTEEVALRPHREYSISQKDGSAEQKLVANNTRVALANADELIFYDKSEQKWYRHLKTAFPIKDVQVCIGELAGNLLLSDGARLYLVPMDTAVITPFRYERPLEDFLKSPVLSVNIVYKFFPCDGRRYEENVLYCLDGNSFVVKKLSLRKKQNDFVKNIPVQQLYKQLEALNVGYDASVKVADIGFTQADYDSLRRFLFSNSRGIFDYLGDSITVERILGVLPQLGDSVWTDIVKTYWDGGCTSYSTLEITFQNQKGKTLVISNTDNACGYGYFPYKTPFQVQCGGYTFPGTSLPFMQFVREIMPPAMVMLNFSHFSLLLKACRYVLWNREKFGI
ncbi:MAG: hypothetical protein IKP54_03080 [Bacteroidales bacterium]|nr:hypothetical protein [Bacteroidales bacterium]